MFKKLSQVFEKKIQTNENKKILKKCKPTK